MKQSFFTILLTVLMSMVGTKAFAHDIEVNNADGVTIYYCWTNDNTELSVTYRGSSYNNYSDEYLGEIVIPESVEYNGKNYSVTSIGQDAFRSCYSLSSITIPGSVKTIGKNAFDWCSKLSSLTLSEGVKVIEENAFYNCRIDEVTIPKSVTAIGENAFVYGYNYGLETPVKINITDLKAWCSISFAKIIAPIKKLLFNGEEIKELVIPDGVTTINSYAFNNCSSLQSVTLPNSLTSIEPEVFAGCLSLAKVISKINDPFVLGENVFPKEVIGLFVPKGTLPLYQERWPLFTKIYEGDGVMPSDAIRFADLLVERICVNNWDTNQDGFFSMTEAAAVTDLGNAFSSKASIITSFDELKYFTGLKSIPAKAFYYCDNLTSVIIPENVMTIGANAFYYSQRLKSLTIPTSVTNINDNAFYYAIEDRHELVPQHRTLNVYISDLAAWCNIDFGSDVFSSLSYARDQTRYTEYFKLYINGSIWDPLIIPEEVTKIKDNVFLLCKSIRYIELHEGITSIGKNSFAYSSVSLVSGGKGLKSIGESAFEGLDISSIRLYDGLTSIGKSAFRNTKLKSIVLPKTLETIGESAFYYCSGLTSITIPNSVTSIGDNAFYGCNDLKYVIFTSASLPTFTYQTKYYKFKVIMPQTAYEKGIHNSITNFVTYSNTPKDVAVKSKGAVSAVLDVYPINDDGSLDEENLVTVTTVGQTPGKYLNWRVNKEDYGILSEKANETLMLEVQEPKALSTKKARLIAAVEEADDVENYGFEWRRIDAPDMIQSSKVSAPLFNGKIVGTLSNLKDDVYYKYRPFYKSESGEMYYGEWTGLFTGDADVFFEPEVYTMDASDITKVSALLAGVWLEGTDDFEEKGFEYWTVSAGNTRAVGNDVKKIAVSGNNMTFTIEGLKAGTVYGYRSYCKTASGTTYGEEKTFITILVGDVNGDKKINKDDLKDIVNYIMGNTPVHFNKKMADLNEDGVIDAADIVNLVNIIK